MFSINSILFITVFSLSCMLFYRNIKKIIRNINLGKKIGDVKNKPKRWKQVFLIAFGQKKMFKKPLVAFLHLFVYVGFVIINIEVIEIILDGIFNTHRILFSEKWAFLYRTMINIFEIFALLVLFSVVVFLVRRNILKVSRFLSSEMKGWPTLDGNLILIFEIFLMSAFLMMNACDLVLQESNLSYKYPKTGNFIVSSLLTPFLSDNLSTNTIFVLERFFWWFHIIGILGFLNYLVISKHLHIIFAFPNTYYSNLNPKGQFSNMSSVTNEVKMMLDPNNDPFAQNQDQGPPERFGVKDVNDLSKVQILGAYSCTECGRCTSECPANQTGKKLSPRKIMMDIRDRAEEVGKNIDKKGKDFDDNKSLLNDYISPEELWACTSCNACVEACPLNIDPLSVIIDMRRYLVMEQSAAPAELNNVFTNIENNGAPWQFSASDRLNWKYDE